MGPDEKKSLDTMPHSLRQVVALLAKNKQAEHLLLNIKDKIGSKQYKTFIVCGAAQWKHVFLRGILSAHGANDVVFVHRSISAEEIDRYLIGQREPVFVSWGMRETGDFYTYAEARNIPFWRIEDGFIRSVGLGAKHIPPASLVIDKTGSMYFRSDKASALETFLETHQFSETERATADNLKNTITELGLTKYNLRSSQLIPKLSTSNTNIIVFGQVEDDASILYGSPVVKTNAQLLDAALQEHSGAQIFYRPHPDVSAGLRLQKSNLDDLRKHVNFLEGPIDIWGQIASFDRVCVMTSLAGFEALQRGMNVRTYGMPFYAGWGVTDDLLSCHRRKARLSLTEILFGAYIQAPTYIDPQTGKLTSIDNVIRLLQKQTHN